MTLALRQPAAAPAGAAQRLRELVERNYGTWRGWVRMLLGQAEWLAGRLGPWTDAARPAPQRLVFVCLGNINRSAFAAAVAERCGAPAPVSIGLSTATGLPAYEMAVTQAAAMGYDLASHRATAVTDYTWRPGDLLLAMEVRHVHALIELGLPADGIALLGWWAAPRRIHLHDPHTLSAEYFATCFALIESAVRALCAAGSGPTATDPAAP